MATFGIHEVPPMLLARTALIACALALLGCGVPVDVTAPCEAAGGACMLGGCEGEVVAVDCNPNNNPGGAVCCAPCAEGTTFVDGGCR